jgi:fatty-acyl-CoA synthase
MSPSSYSHGASKTPLLGETISANLKRTVQKYPNQDALVSIHQDYRATYKELWQQVEEVAKALLSIGLRQGERIGIWSPNRYEWVLLQYATARVGVILVNINPAYRTSELIYVLNQSKTRFLFASLKFKTSDYFLMVQEAKSSCPDLEKALFFENDWNSFLESGKKITDSELADAENNLHFDEAINLQYTSGTTGFPKGAKLSHHNLLNNGFFIGERLKYTEKDRVCIPVPFYHCFGMVIGNLACTTHGSCIVIPSESFDPKKSLEAVSKEKCTSLYGVPTMFIAELELADFDQYDLKTLRTGVMAGSPCPVEVMKKVQSRMFMKEVSICYGMTETSPVSLQTLIGAPLEKQVSTVGTVQDHLEIKIVDPETQLVTSRGVPGELCTRGYSVMLGYWDNEKATDEAIDESGWMHTGDLAVMDEEGYVNIVGRIKDMILRGGENIYPREIEEFLYTHPDIEDVQVIGIPSEKFGEEVMAWVKLKVGHLCNEEDLKSFCNQKIAHYKVPRFWKFVESFPTTVTGKIKKVDMRTQSIRELNLEHLTKIKTS